MINKKEKEIVLSGIQPSGNLCIGNYIGAMRNWISLQEDYSCIYLLVDQHAITVNQNPAVLRNRCYSFIAQYLACGINPKKSIVAIQSHVYQHSELMWVLASMTYMGELNRMTQFKDKSLKHDQNINSALFSYPVLMAADILLYQAEYVPVGNDQKQHLELARNLAQRFNSKYSQTFTVPKPLIPKYGARIMSLQSPDKKMSKSDKNENNIISLLDDENVIRRKIMKAITDSDNKIAFVKEKEGISNLISIYSALTNMNIDTIVNNYENKSYSVFKSDLSDVVIDMLKPIQDEYKHLINNKDYLNEVLKDGSERAFYIARKTMTKVKRKVGFIL